MPGKLWTRNQKTYWQKQDISPYVITTHPHITLYIVTCAFLGQEAMVKDILDPVLYFLVFPDL
jgi:hypothetical protein